LWKGHMKLGKGMTFGRIQSWGFARIAFRQTTSRLLRCLL
jgi:hypothetical protein